MSELIPLALMIGNCRCGRPTCRAGAETPCRRRLADGMRLSCAAVALKSRDMADWSASVISAMASSRGDDASAMPYYFRPAPAGGENSDNDGKVSGRDFIADERR